MIATHKNHIRGYIEGYYGRWLAWGERSMIVDTLAQHGMNAYLYAPKEDPCHRLNWRCDWDNKWWQGFTAFSHHAKALGVDTIAGIAPGIDFDFSRCDGSRAAPQTNDDYAILLQKARKLYKAGAAAICLLFDDIDPLFASRKGAFTHEGEAHASLANRLAQDLPCPIAITPRIYADEVTDNAGGYLENFTATLNPDIGIFTCGSHIIAHRVDTTTLMGLGRDNLIIWDNLYAHDYCPRRLFLGRYRGRDGLDNVMLNPTGLPHTDCLLLGLMAAGDDATGWHDAFINHTVPEAFFTIAHLFDLPPKPGDTAPDIALDEASLWLDALETLLWQWKTPLQREWYPYLKALKDDILLATGQIDRGRINRLFPPLLTHQLLKIRGRG